MVPPPSSASSKYVVYGGGRWRDLDSGDGSMSGWGRVGFVVLRRGKLHVVKRRRVLAALTARAGSRTAVKLGPQYTKKNETKFKARCMRHSSSTQTTPIKHCNCCQQVENNSCAMMRSSPGLSMPLLDIEPAPQIAPGYQKTSVCRSITTDASVQTIMSSVADADVTSPPPARIDETSPPPAPAGLVQRRASFPNPVVVIKRWRVLDEILQQHVEALRSASSPRRSLRAASQRTLTLPHPSPPRRSRSRSRSAPSPSPSPAPPRATPRPSSPPRARPHTASTLSRDSETDKENFQIRSLRKRVATGPIVTPNNTKKLCDAPCQKPATVPKTKQILQKKTSDIKLNGHIKDTRDRSKNTSNFKNNSQRSNKLSNKTTSNTKSITRNEKRVTPKRRKVSELDSIEMLNDDEQSVANDNSNRVRNKVTVSPIEKMLEIDRELKEKIKEIDKNSRSLPKEYSSLEDHAIVAWISVGDRAQLVNGNRVWRQLEPQFPALAGRARSWHSLRNRYLRSLLPALAHLALPPRQQQALRAAAARGEIKQRYKRYTQHSSSPPSPTPPPPRTPRSLRYSDVTRRFAARHRTPSPSPSPPRRPSSPPSPSLNRRSLRYSDVTRKFAARHRTSSPSPSPPRRPSSQSSPFPTRRSLRYSDVTRKFAARHRILSSSPSPPRPLSPPRPPPPPGPTGTRRNLRRLYNPNHTSLDN